MTWGALEQLSDACASAFHALGVRHGDRVALLLPNCPQFSIAQFGAWKLGAMVAPLNPTYTEHELEGPLRENGVETIVTLTRFYHRVKHVQPRTPLRRVIATNIKEYFPPALRLLFTLLREKHDGDRVSIAPGDHDLAHLLLLNRGRRAPRAVIGPEDPAVLLMSCGTTGAKGVVGTQRVRHLGDAVADLERCRPWRTVGRHVRRCRCSTSCQRRLAVVRDLHGAPWRWCPTRAIWRISWRRYDA
jgi:long-chain acyl-CoA synthetase